MRTLFFVLVICFVSLCNINLFAAYKVDLSSPPENRWTGLVNQYDKGSLRHYAANLNQAMADVSYILEFQWVREMSMRYGWYGSMETDVEWFTDLRAEIKGLAEALKKRMDGESLKGFREEDLFLLNIGYDFSTYCTTGVFQTDQGPVLFRNLDWEGDDFRKFTTAVDFEKNGKTIFKSIQFLGQVGVLTAMKPQAYAVALNFRKTPGAGTFGWQILYNVSQFTFKEGWSVPILLRYILEHEPDFSAAKAKFISTELVAPCYLILAGVQTNEGVVIERGRDANHTRNFSDPLENPKFLVQTNHDVPKPLNQDENWAGDDLLLNESLGMGTVSRRNAAVNFLQSIDQSNLNKQLMEMLTNHWPVSNSLTIFSSVLTPVSDELELAIHEIR